MPFKIWMTQGQYCFYCINNKMNYEANNNVLVLCTKNDTNETSSEGLVLFKL